MAITGAGFVTDSQVYLDGAPLATTYISASQLSSNLSKNDVATAKIAQLIVVNPQPSNAPQSAASAFTITAAPMIQTVTPAMARVGGAAVAIQITGSGFTSQSAVTWNGTPLTTSFVSAIQLKATVPSQLLAVIGTVALRVTQQSPGGGNSLALAFTVYDAPLPQPEITTLSPAAVPAGSSDLVLQVSGSGILSTTTALWNGTVLPSTFLSPGSILALVPAADMASPGQVTIQLQNPADDTGRGGGLSNAVILTIFDSTTAATTDYTSASAFALATSNITTIGFNGILSGGLSSEAFSPLSLYGITFLTPTPTTTVNVTASDYAAPATYSADYIVNSAIPSANTLVISLPKPTYALGINYGGLSGTGMNTITLSNGHVLTQALTAATGKTQFAGFVSVDPITSLTLTTSNDSWVVSNLLIGSPLAPITFLSSSSDPSVAGQAVTFKAMVTPASGAAAATGSVVFLDGGTEIGTAILDNTGTATFQAFGLSVGTHAITAQYVGDKTYNGGSLSAALIQTVNPATPTITWNCASSLIYGTPVGGSQLDATASVPGMFSYSPTIGTILPAGSSTLSVTFTPTDTVNYTPAKGTCTLTINQAPLTVTAANATRPYGTANPIFTGTVSGAVNGDTFSISGTTSATISSDLGDYSIIPTISGADLSDYTVTLVDGTLTIVKDGSNILLLSSNLNVNLNSPLTLTAVVASSGMTGLPTGTVNFLDGGALLGSVLLNNQAAASYTTSSLAPGLHSITAVYTGSPHLASSTPSTLTETIVAPDFRVAANPTSLTVTRGGMGTAVFTITPVGGFNQAVQFSCSGLPVHSACIFNPGTITPTGASVASTLTITTDVNTALATEPGRGRLLATASNVRIVLGSCLLFWFFRRKRSGAYGSMSLWTIVVGITFLYAGISVMGCGSGQAFPITPLGTSTVTITASASPGGGISHNTLLSLTISQ